MKVISRATCDGSAVARRFLFWVLAMVAALSISGCGGGGGSPSASPPVVPAAITLQPVSVSSVDGTSASFSVVATGDGIGLQWQRSTDQTASWQDIAGATAATYTIALVDSSLNGYLYRVLITGPASSVVSSAVTLSVSPAVVAATIAAQPAAQTATAGGAVTFAVTASGTSLAYQWQVSPEGANWADLSGATGATGATLTLSAVATTDNGKQFRAVISNSLGSVTSSPVLLTVNPALDAPQITAQPQSTSVVAPQAASFSVVASGSAVLAYQWQQSADNGASYADIPLATGAAYATPATVAGDTGKLYRVRVTNNAGSVVSTAAVLTVAQAPAAPTITLQPVGRSVVAPATATFSASATGSPTPGYQWQQTADYTGAFTNINGATSASYTTPATALPDGGKRFRLVATNSSGTAVSDSAVLTVSSAGGLATVPDGIAVDAGGNVYVGISCSLAISLSQPSPFCGIQVISASGTVSKLAGGSTVGSVDGTGAAARFAQPVSLAVDGSGNVFVVDQQAIRKVTPSGVVTTLAGGAQGFADGTGSNARFLIPEGIVVDPSGDLYVADNFNCAIRKVTAGGVVTTFVGPQPATCGYVDATGSAARLNGPAGLAMDGAGNLYFADYGNNLIRKVSPAGAVTTLAGGGTPGLLNKGFIDGSSSDARFNGPWGVAVDSVGNVYVSDINNHAIRKVTPAGSVTTLAGGSVGYVDAVGTAAKFSSIRSIAIDRNGNVLVTDSSVVNNLIYNAVRKVSPDGAVTTLSN